MLPLTHPSRRSVGVTAVDCDAAGLISVESSPVMDCNRCVAVDPEKCSTDG